MATIKDAKTLVKENYFTNLSADEGMNMTMMLSGPHGIGKTKIIQSAAKDLGGYCFTIEGGSLKEGEITGLPFAQQNADGSSEVRFIRYYIINKCWQLEKYYYEIARTRGFLDGKVRLEEDGAGNQWLIEFDKKTQISSAVDSVVSGEDNRYKFGEQLSSETKLKLIESGEIKPVFIFIDELNRTEQQTMKELMNITLNKSVNGFDLSWWVNIVAAVNPSSQNSTYATNELDPAQLSRFCKIRVDAVLENWIDYALDKHMNSDVVEAIAISEAIFNQKDSSTQDMAEMTPDPRAWDMVAHVYDTIHDIVRLKFFDAEERSGVEDDLRIIINGKVGETAGRTLLANISRKENNIKPQEILTGKQKNIAPEVVQKFRNQKTLTKKIISDNLVNYLMNEINEIYKGKTSTDPKKKEAYMNYMSQLKEFTNLLDTATQILFVKKILKRDKEVPGVQLFQKVSSVFSNEILMNIQIAKQALKDIND